LILKKQKKNFDLAIEKCDSYTLFQIGNELKKKGEESYLDAIFWYENAFKKGYESAKLEIETLKSLLPNESKKKRKLE